MTFSHRTSKADFGVLKIPCVLKMFSKQTRVKNSPATGVRPQQALEKKIWNFLDSAGTVNKLVTFHYAQKSYFILLPSLAERGLLKGPRQSSARGIQASFLFVEELAFESVWSNLRVFHQLTGDGDLPWYSHCVDSLLLANEVIAPYWWQTRHTSL